MLTCIVNITAVFIFVFKILTPFTTLITFQPVLIKIRLHTLPGQKKPFYCNTWVFILRPLIVLGFFGKYAKKNLNSYINVIDNSKQWKLTVPTSIGPPTTSQTVQIQSLCN